MDGKERLSVEERNRRRDGRDYVREIATLKQK